MRLFRVYAVINELTNTIAKQWLDDVLIAESIANQVYIFQQDRLVYITTADVTAPIDIH